MTTEPGTPPGQPGMPPPPPTPPPIPPPPPPTLPPAAQATPTRAESYAQYAMPRTISAVAQHQPHLPPTVTIASPWARLGAYFLESLLALVTLGIGWLIWAAMIAGNGQTPAKRLLGQRVIDAATLQPASFAKMFWVRGLLAGIVAWIAIVFTLGIILFMPFWDKRNQNVWDKVSNTYVVNDPNDAWGRKPDLR